MDSGARIEAAQRSLAGLSVGDALGKTFFLDRDAPPDLLLARRSLPRGTWSFTDDTVMAVSLVDVLAEHGEVAQDALAAAFAARFRADPERGYGAVAYWLLFQLGLGRPWRELTREIFRGEGSCGNGAAMRVAPLGAYFADDLDRVVLQADLSAEVTHSNPEGRAGAIAVAVAAAASARGLDDLLALAAARTPAGPTCDGLLLARALQGVAPAEAARRLGDGAQLLAQDTVPFALWCAARHPHDYEAAAWTALAGLTDPDSDRDTVLAIVGGVVGARAAPPPGWLEAREPLGGA